LAGGCEQVGSNAGVALWVVDLQECHAVFEPR
jgi:hypothetical protein